MAEQVKDVFQQLKDGLSAIDPVAWCEEHLCLDGRPFRLSGTGYKPLSDIYRFIGVKALEKSESKKDVVFVKGRQTGGTTLANFLEIYFLASGLFGTETRPPMRMMHIFPHQESALKYSKTKFSSSMRSAVASHNNPSKEKNKPGTKSFIEQRLDKSSPANDSISFKQFEGGNHIFIEYPGTNGERLRGGTIDFCVWDETQSYIKPSETFGNVNKCLSKAQWGAEGEGVKLYIGTPLSKGSEYHKLWNASSKQYYHLGCIKCKEYFPFYTSGSNDWEKIWLHGFIVKCPLCGFEQDKRDSTDRGKWIATNNEATSYIGYHLNQLYLPNYTRERIEAEKPENHPTNTERTYQNEVLGEFYSGDSSPITLEEIDLYCADRTRKFRASISPSENKRAYLGIDFGSRSNLYNDSDEKNVTNTIASKIAGGQSYSCVCVLVPNGNVLEIQFAKRLENNTVEHKKNIIEQIFRQYSIVQAVGDIGYSRDLSEILQSQFGERYLTSTASGKLLNKFKYVPEATPRTIMFERDFLLDELFGLMKKGRIKIPFGNYEQVGWLINHICFGLEKKTVISKFGEQSERYVKSSAPSDGLMALLAAYLSFKFDVTKGFTISQGAVGGNFDFNAQVKKPSIVLAYAPRRR